MDLASSTAGFGVYTITNSTVSTNTATSGGAGGRGGGIHIGGFAQFPQSLLVSASTLAANTAQLGEGGNLWVNGPADFVDLRGSIVSGGTGAAGVENCAQTVSGHIDSLGGNVESTTPTQCGLGLASDRIGVDPLLGPLTANAAGNAGSPIFNAPRQTHPLGAGSAALNLYSAGCPGADQIGTARPQGPLCDAGAHEMTDADGDGLPDAFDGCPSQSGSGSNGCPAAATPPAETGQRAAALKKCKKKKSKKARKKCRKKARKLPV
jgi:hypothetical protein